MYDKAALHRLSSSRLWVNLLPVREICFSISASPLNPENPVVCTCHISVAIRMRRVKKQRMKNLAFAALGKNHMSYTLVFLFQTFF